MIGNQDALGIADFGEDAQRNIRHHNAAAMPAHLVPIAPASLAAE